MSRRGDYRDDYLDWLHIRMANFCRVGINVRRAVFAGYRHALEILSTDAKTKHQKVRDADMPKRGSGRCNVCNCTSSH